MRRRLPLSRAPRRAACTEAELRSPMRLKTVRTDGTTARFYGAAGSEEVVDAPAGGRHALLLEGRPVLTPGGRRLAVPTAALASALALEWEAQGHKIKPTSMPLTTLATTALDQMEPKRDKVLEALYRFAVTDTVCFRAGGDAADSLVKLQKKHWDPLLRWAREEYGVRLNVTEHVHQLEQPEADLGRLWKQVNLLDDWHLAVLDSLASTTKSMLIPLALMRNVLTVQQAYHAARVDEDWQIRSYGRVEGVYGHGVDIAYTRMQLAASRTFLNLLEGVHARQ